MCNTPSPRKKALLVDYSPPWCLDNLLIRPALLPCKGGGVASGAVDTLKLSWNKTRKPHVPRSKLLVFGMVILPLIGNPYNGYINRYYWVDDHPLLRGNNGFRPHNAYDESRCETCPGLWWWDHDTNPAHITSHPRRNRSQSWNASAKSHQLTFAWEIWRINPMDFLPWDP